MSRNHNVLLLSHTLSESSPGYGGKQGFFRKQTRKICEGDTCNNEEWTLSNHMGTHMDFPLHFFAEGKGLTDFLPTEFVNYQIQLLELPGIEPSTLIDPSFLEGKILADTEILLLKTHFEKHRAEETYWSRGPGMHPESANYLREVAPNIKMIGFDFISLSSYTNREVGRVAHRQFLDPQKPILIIEDMALEKLTVSPKQMVISPLWVEKSDGAPVTVWAFP